VIDLDDGEMSDIGYDNKKGNASCMPMCCVMGNNTDAKMEPLKKPSSLFGDKTFKEVCRETQKKSIYGKVPNYGLVSLIVKSPDNLTQE